jgi:phosphoserine phosphatase RsbU/P
MRRFTSLPRPALLTLAGIYAVIAVGFVVIHSYELRAARSGDPGLEAKYSPADRFFAVARVTPGGAAQQAGLRAGDRVVALNHLPVEPLSFDELMLSTKAGETVQLTVQRPGRKEPFTLPLTLRLAPPPQMFLNMGAGQHVVVMFLQAYPILFLVVGLAVLFLRLDNPSAWLLALVFGGFLAGGPIFAEAVAGLKPFEGFIHPAWLRGAFVSFETVMWPLWAALFYYFFATFPNRSPLERRLPWLKVALLVLAASYAVWLEYYSVKAGFVSIVILMDWLGAEARLQALSVFEDGLLLLFPLVMLSSAALGLASLVWNSLRPASPEARRKTRVMVWGTVAGVFPGLLINAPYIIGKSPPKLPWWAFVLLGFLACLVPLSFAYAVVKHRVLEIPVLLKRSARYLLVKQGFVLFTMLATAAAFWLFYTVFTRFFRVHGEFALSVGLGVGITLGAISTRANLYLRQRITQRIDRAFFRSAYDAGQVLESLATRTRKAAAREQLAELLESEIIQALHPASVAVYLEGKDDRLRLQSEGPPSVSASLVWADTPWLQELARRGEPFEVPPSQASGSSRPPAFGSVQPECLVPLAAGDGHVTGLIVLGARLSEEPYSREDKQLLASVASQAGLALEGIRLGEQIAERIEAEQRVALEMEYAKQVQARLFPQKVPPLATMDYAGRCIQARQVGGDYYDFLSLGSGRIGIVLADVAGKGISGALLMANLQANLRSQYAVALENLPQLLESVNQLFYENTDDHSYATLFFADYNDSSRRLRYVNCGHLPPLLLRANGGIERLSATATVLGLFEKWESAAVEMELNPGDVLAVYSDGITEAASVVGEEFGECRLLETIKGHSHLPACALLQSIADAVQQFAGAEQQDDMTLVVARALA